MSRARRWHCSFEQAIHRLLRADVKSADTRTGNDLENHRKASREALDAVIDRFAMIEAAADLEPGSLVGGLLSPLAEADPDGAVSHVADGYAMRSAPDGWREAVRAAVRSTRGAAERSGVAA